MMTSAHPHHRRARFPSPQQCLILVLIVFRAVVVVCQSEVLEPPHRSEEAEATPKPISEPKPTKSARPNVLILVCDQLRFDALGYVQDRMPHYDGKFKIRTPNLDRLARLGVSFENAYCASPICGPSRASLKTGCTVTRTGMVSNRMCKPDEVWKNMKVFQDRIERMVTYEQILASELNYNVESYGKWHTAQRLYYSLSDPEKPIVRYTVYDFETNEPQFEPVLTYQETYEKTLDYVLERDKVNTTLENLQQINSYSSRGYDPIRLDSRFGYPANTSMDDVNLPRYKRINANICGRDSLGPSYTSTTLLAKSGLYALDRNIREYKETQHPFLLSIHFNAPHPPMVATKLYFDRYFQNRSELHVPPSILDPMNNSHYANSRQRRRMRAEGKNYGYNDPSRIAELTATYYSMVEEVDTWVGILMNRLDKSNVTNDTMIVFTSDHGELLGAHGMTGKVVLLEEAARVPLIMYYPNFIEGGRIVDRSVSQLDIFATLLDYTGGSEFDASDGSSLRRFIEGTSFNEDYDDDVVVVELNGRWPLNENRLSGHFGAQPNWMVRKDNFKLILPRKHNSGVMDMMYDVDKDPHEMNNLLGEKGMDASSRVIGKAEHLKALLLEWMTRHDTFYRYFSDPKYNNNQGLGDIMEMTKRRTWRKVPVWFSEEQVMRFGDPVFSPSTSRYVRKEYLYIGRTDPGNLTLLLDMDGEDAYRFALETDAVQLTNSGYVRITVLFASRTKVSISSLNAVINVRIDGDDDVELERAIRIVAYDFNMSSLLQTDTQEGSDEEKEIEEACIHSNCTSSHMGDALETGMLASALLSAGFLLLLVEVLRRRALLRRLNNKKQSFVPRDETFS